MLTYNEFIDLRKKLVNNEIELKYAQDQCWGDFKEGKRSWHTKDWKERRAEIIKDRCEICNSSEILTLQHQFHPNRYLEFEKELNIEYTKKYISENSGFDKDDFKSYIIECYRFEPIPQCPNCKSRKPNKRSRKVPQFLCIACREEFNEPFFASLEEALSNFYSNKTSLEAHDKCFISRDKYQNQQNLLNVEYWYQRKLAKIKYGELIIREAFIKYLDANIRYLSFSDTITACKKCAANWDLKMLELCPSCKVNYKGIHYQTCIQCLPEPKRTKALEKVEFGKNWNTIEKKLGID